MAASLDGKVIGFLEARMRSELGSLIERNGGVPYSAPVLQEIYLKDSPPVQQLVQDICLGLVEVVVFQTGVGAEALLETANAMGRQKEFLRGLDQQTVIVRSPKPASVMRRHQVHIDVMPPEPYTTEELLEASGGIDFKDRRVAIQAYGSPNGLLISSLTDMGAQVDEVTLYAWGLPEDVDPVLKMIDDLAQGGVDALAFTSQPQVGNLLAIAAQGGVEELLRKGLGGQLAVGSVGPVCSRRLSEEGIQVDVEPEHPHMGNLVQALAEFMAAGRD